MTASGEGKTEAEALAAVLDVTPESFDADFAAWMREKLVEVGPRPRIIRGVRGGGAEGGRRRWRRATGRRP